MATKKTTRKSTSTKRETRRQDGVTLITRTEQPVADTPVMGSISTTTEGVYDFYQSEDALFARTAVRTWICIRQDAKKHLRITKNKNTGEYKITYKLTLDEVKALNNREVSVMTDNFAEQLERIQNFYA